MHKNFGLRGWSRLSAGVGAVALASGLALAASGATAPQATATTQTTAKTSTAVPAKIDVNGASKAQLAKLPGIGDAYSQRIIDGRPYKTKTELESRKILPKSVYDQIAPLIIAHQR